MTIKRSTTKSAEILEQSRRLDEHQRQLRADYERRRAARAAPDVGIVPLRESDYSRICAACGLTFGSHRGDSTVPDQCPAHEGCMDWPTAGITTFRDSGEQGEVPYGTPSKVA
jgi:hypothetical protein